MESVRKEGANDQTALRRHDDHGARSSVRLLVLPLAVAYSGAVPTAVPISVPAIATRVAATSLAVPSGVVATAAVAGAAGAGNASCSAVGLVGDTFAERVVPAVNRNAEASCPSVGSQANERGEHRVLDEILAGSLSEPSAEQETTQSWAVHGVRR